MGLADAFYNVFARRNSIYIATIIVGAFAGEKVVHAIGDSLWESNNQGKLYKHMTAEEKA